MENFNCNWAMKMCAVFLLWSVTAIALPAQTFTSLHSFNGTDGANPYAGLLQGSDGNLYGTTFAGGSKNLGTVFNISTGGTLTSLHSFDATEGSNPFGRLVQGNHGSFYGTSSEDGANSVGTFFNITFTGKLTTLHSFNSTDGATPYGGLTLGVDGSFYGTTQSGGASGYGTVFQITLGGKVTTLHSFNKKDGDSPSGALLLATNGNFFGTTQSGGTHNLGTVFEMTSSGTVTRLHSFNGTDGSHPSAGLVQGADGNLYGTTDGGGTSSSGTIFGITPGGTITTLYSFCSQPVCADGKHPVGALIQATDGNFYGTTTHGGADNDGTIYQFAPNGGGLTVLHSFDGADGEQPYAELFQDTDGTFYGTTNLGGANDVGTVFGLSTGLSPFVSTLPGFGKIGARIGILGTDLTEATSVTFNGTAAVFNVVSSSLIDATLPSGATTGVVQVMTPSGTLTSNVPFIVLH
jgi:uncharacterized repeat protein (TIGR03803 family)